MSNQFTVLRDGLNIKVTSATPGAVNLGDITINSATSNIQYFNGSVLSDIDTASNTLTLTNKSISASANTLTNIVNSCIAAGAAIAYSKLNLAGSILGTDISPTAAIPYSTLNLASSIQNSDIASAAAIAYSKLNLSGSILNSDISSAAAIAYSKLNLAGSILNSDIASNAAISYSKLNLASSVKLASDVTGTLPIANGGTGQITASAAFNALSPITSVGDLIIGTGTNISSRLPLGTVNQALISNGSTAAWTTIQQGAKNYIAYNNFENNATTGWSLGTIGTLTNGLPTGSPTFGSGAAGTLSFSTISIGQLAGSYSGSLVSTAATTAGNMLASQAYTIDAEDQAKVLTFKFYYSVPSGAGNANFSGTSANSFGVAIWDATNSSWLSSTANFGMTQSSGIGYVTGTAQTNINTTSLRLVVYAANATSGAIALTLDDFYLGPQTAPLGAVITDWVPYTPTFTGFGSVTNNGFFSRRVGDTLHVVGGFITGTPTAVGAQVSIGYNGANANVTINTAKIAVINNVIGSVAVANAFAGKVDVLYVPSLTQSVGFGLQNASSAGETFANANVVIGSNQALSVEFFVPIVGWSSNLQMSSDTDTRVITATMALSGAPAVAANTPIKYDTVLSDTAGGYSTATGLYTITVTGSYQLGVGCQANGSSNLYVVKNGTGVLYITAVDSTNYIEGGAVTLAFKAGDSVGIYSDTARTFAASTTQGYINFWSITRVGGPSVIAATESVNGTYDLTSSQSVSANTPIKYDTKIKDSHGAYSSLTGLITIPVSGEFRFSVIANGSVASTSVYLKQNGTSKGYLCTLTSSGSMFGGTKSLPCLAGDTIGFYVDTSITANAATTNGSVNSFSFERVGN